MNLLGGTPLPRSRISRELALSCFSLNVCDLNALDNQ